MKTNTQKKQIELSFSYKSPSVFIGHHPDFPNAEWCRVVECPESDAVLVSYGLTNTGNYRYHGVRFHDWDKARIELTKYVNRRHQGFLSAGEH
jgi:hypothetical protein